jgi:alginate O-acetyltransferase complex protein AlgI
MIITLSSFSLAKIYKVKKLHHSFLIFGVLFLVTFGLLLGLKSVLVHSILADFVGIRLPIKIIGLSYILFRAMSYIVDSDINDDLAIIPYINYLFFFPSLLAGPIARYKEFQNSILLSQKPEQSSQLLSQINRILSGFVKKFVIADNLMIFIDTQQQFSLTSNVSTEILWLSILLTLFVIYMDFSGYCDIAIGLAALMGIHLPENFRSPWLASNVQEFWTRWHISLTEFIRDYVFVPLSRLIYKGCHAKYHWFLITMSYMFCMVLITLWHGLTFGFLIFGILHACALFMIQLGKQYKLKPWPKPMAGVATYLFVSFTIWLGVLPNELIWKVAPQLIKF